MQEFNTRQAGRIGETIACNWLVNNGYTIIERNHYSSHGEIDIIAEMGKYICFVEVKSRSDIPELLQKYGRPSEAVNYTKRQRILYSVKDYLYKNKTSMHPRIDVMEIYISKIEECDFISAKINYIKSAFGADTK